MKRHYLTLALTTLFSLAACCMAAEEKPQLYPKLAEIFPAGSDWQVAAQDLSFADGSSADAAGNLYFSDLGAKKPVVKPAALYRLSPDGTQTKLADANMSGTKMGPDGKLYGCGGGKVMVFDLATGKSSVLAEGLKTNDLTVTSKGMIYITETGKKQVTRLDPKTGKTSAADIGITAPNGIAVTVDQAHLLVSDYGGLNVWKFTINPDGSLTDKKAWATMKAPEKKPTVAGGDGMTVDSACRAYVTTALGLQIFDCEGQLLGIVPKPQNGPLTNAAFAGSDLSTLFVTCGNKVFKRKTSTRGFLNYQEAPLTGGK